MLYDYVNIKNQLKSLNAKWLQKILKIFISTVDGTPTRPRINRFLFVIK